MKPKILITVEGGIIQNISSNTDVDVVILDYDTDNAEEPVIIQRGPQDSLFKNGDAYKMIDSEYPLSNEEKEAREYLKNEKF